MSKHMIIDGKKVEFEQEKNILEVVRKAGIELPTFCYYSDLSVYGACRMCVVEDERGSVTASCSTQPRDGMEIKTNTTKLRKYRKMILELLLASHCQDCTTCEKTGKCHLQEFAHRFGIKDVRFPNHQRESIRDDSSPSIVRDNSKCILCGDCVRMCNEIQHVGAIDFARRGAEAEVMTAFNRPIAETECVNCGQCAAVCPTGAISIKNDIGKVWKAIDDKHVRVVAQVAPAVRVALGEEFGMESGTNVIGKTFAALRIMGFDEVYDTSFSADLTIMEETKEFLERMEKGNLPLFTSCCPAWIRYAQTKHPELLKHISTAKSPMQMFGSVMKAYFKEKDEQEQKRTVTVAIMPCTAKKYEASRGEFVRNGETDTDYVLTTQELSVMIKEHGIRFKTLEAESPDTPFAIYSGAGVIFGVTGGVTEAVIRRVAGDRSAKGLQDIEFIGVRGLQGVKVFDLPLGEKKLRIGVVNGLGNAEALIEKMQKQEIHLDFVEVMACPGGCIAGGGQPYGSHNKKNRRAGGLYQTDREQAVRASDQNPLMDVLYAGILKNREHELLHVHYKK